MTPPRVLALVDGEHYPPVVRAALDAIPERLGGAEVVAAVLIGGGEKLATDLPADLGLGVEVVRAEAGEAGGDQVLTDALARFCPDVVVDLSDEPVLDARTRLRLAARTLAAGVPYVGADFRIDPPPRPHIATKPTVAVVGTGKRTGKTAISAALARLLAQAGAPPVVVAMGRGGPPEPELIDPQDFDLTPEGLRRLAASGRHAASDHIEDALMAGVVTIGTRRCGGGLAGAPFDSNFVDGVRMANERPESTMILEGSGAAWPPVHADATVCVVPAGIDPELLSGYLGAYRLLLSDLIVVTMAEAAFAEIGARAPPEKPFKAPLEEDIRRLAPGARVVHTVFRPWPLEPISGSRVFYVTTAPASARSVLVAHLEMAHGATVVGTSHNLARRPELLVDLQGACDADIVLVELKAAAVDVVAVTAAASGQKVVFCDNRPVSVGGDGMFDALALATADLATTRFRAARGEGL